MPNGQIGVVKKPRPEVMAISALLAAGGVGMILLWAMQRSEKGYGDLRQIAPGELMSQPISPTLEGSGVVSIRIGEGIAALMPTVMYVGPGRDTFSYFQVKQRQYGEAVTVYGSGVAGVHVGPAAEPMVFPLVAADQPQPGGCPAQALCAFNYPGPPGAENICGGPPMPGYGDAYLEIYQRQDPQDGDGFASPTCGSADVPIPRVPIITKIYRGKVLFKA